MKSKVIKSPAKAAGLKSILVHDNIMYLTYFDKGPQGGLEKKVTKQKDVYEVLDIANPIHFDAKANRVNIDIQGTNGIIAKPSNPFYSNKVIGMDLVRTKYALEQQIFGQRFMNDNIHVQIAYQVLDILKALVPYINDITYSLNAKIALKDLNLDKDDFFEINPKKIDDSKNERLLQGMMDAIKNNAVYFQEVFYDIKKDKLILKSTDLIKSYLKILTKLRQTVSHYDNSNSHYIFSGGENKEDIQLLKNLFENKREKVNKDFIDLNKRSNFFILDKIFNIHNLQQSNLMHQYFYEYSILSMHKNIGFSIKTLREEILKLEGASRLLSTEYDSVRGKMYNLLDFILYHYFEIETRGVITQSIVEDLRKNQTEEGKLDIYSRLAVKTLSAVKSKLETLEGLMNGDTIQKINREKTVIRDFQPKLVKGNFLVFIIYFITLFLDKKEVNDLTTTIINKLENIAAFQKVYKEITGHNIEFLNEYQVLENAEQTAKEMRFVQVMGLKKPELIITHSLLLDAHKILGYQPRGDEKDILKETNATKEFRNFLINSVIKSRKFVYLIKHVRAEDISKMAKNKYLVEYVLHRIAKNAPSQIDRYYKTITGQSDGTSKEKIEKLTHRISQLKYSDFAAIKTKTVNPFREQSKALIGLYLTVLQILYKNLVNVNARYTMGFWALEKDTLLHQIPYKGHIPLLGLVEKFLYNSDDPEEAWLKKSQIQIIKQNLSDLGQGKEKHILIKYRNLIAHQNVIRKSHELLKDIRHVDSYFQLFHIAIQKQLNEMIKDGTVNPSSKIKDQLAWVEKNNQVSKNLLHTLNLPFAYNTARYNKLSIGDLFDRNEEK